MAVYTDVTLTDLKSFLGKYDIGIVFSFEGITQGQENTNYHLRVKKNGHSQLTDYILTIFERRVRREDLPFFLGLMEYLALHKIPCPRPIKNSKGHMIGKLKGKPAAILSFVPGLSVVTASVLECSALGEALANLHITASAFPQKRPNNMSFNEWRRLLEESKKAFYSDQPETLYLVENELDYLENLWPKKLPFGLIHADLFPDNVFFRGSKISGLIDFYFACNDFLSYDLSICLNAWCFERNGKYNNQKGYSLLKAYNTLRPLHYEEYNALPILARGSALRFVLTRLYDKTYNNFHTSIRPKDPSEFLDRLKFHQRVQRPEVYGLEEKHIKK
ncbi:MAG: homoserine kinase [Alphaproteobacteria bacterium]|jgi:homoserine kinase type II|nr:homoserine kinase [Alphaproteobacteria bacterium]PPR14400.1 MAG: Homoserine kinase [Alphaproteobacteria bacterium MarineAlpha12_Bin1]|tara:strand:- start:695 stop:1693 length:999 start_codon:yes stop_codon:yes gene_type:complete